MPEFSTGALNFIAHFNRWAFFMPEGNAMLLQGLPKQFRLMRGRLNFEIDKTGNMAKAELYRMGKRARKEIFSAHTREIDIPQDGRIMSEYMSVLAIKRFLATPTIRQQLHKMGWE